MSLLCLPSCSVKGFIDSDRAASRGVPADRRVERYPKRCWYWVSNILLSRKWKSRASPSPNKRAPGTVTNHPEGVDPRNADGCESSGNRGEQNPFDSGNSTPAEVGCHLVSSRCVRYLYFTVSIVMIVSSHNVSPLRLMMAAVSYVILPTVASSVFSAEKHPHGIPPRS